ncbi:MAG: phospho-N-acetylmuramoyl-pentapeptide-transferase [Rikenellaceae bacterium]
MIKYLADLIESSYGTPGFGMFEFISFRAAVAIIFSLLLGTLWGRKLIDYLRKKQIGEDIRELGLEGQNQKKGTPTMGGLIIIFSLLIPVLLFCDLTNIYIQLMILSTVWLGIIGFADDYIKVFKKRKEGLSGKMKIVGQVGLGVIIGVAMWQCNDVVVRVDTNTKNMVVSQIGSSTNGNSSTAGAKTIITKNSVTTIPFLKDNEFDYDWLSPAKDGDTLGWLIYIAAAVIIITAVSNGANLTDGLDGLTAGTSAVIGAVLGLLAYMSGNIMYADYLNILYIPGSGELLVFCAAFVGAIVGFLWYNCHPAQVFMGDTGSLAIGGIIAIIALLIRKELLLPILCGVFLVESLSVILQVSYFKYTKKRYGEGRRILKMAPLHHHYQKKGFAETKIVNRFWIIQFLLAAITLITLKIR